MNIPNSIPSRFSASLPKFTARVCKASFWRFVQEFWCEVPGAGIPIWNWHIPYLCNELEIIASRVFRNEPKTHDLLVNVPPGTSKSTLFSILFPAWNWTRMAHARHIIASHTDRLVLDLATKSRTVINSERYHRYFPDIELKSDQDAKGYFSNTAGGDRFSCTVAGQTPTGMHAHFQCFPYHVKILTDIGMLFIGDIVENNLNIRVLGYNHTTNECEWKNIEARGSSPGRKLCKITLSNGITISATWNHPFYVVGKGYIDAIDLQPEDEVIYVDAMWMVREASVSESREGKEEQREKVLLQSEMLCEVYGRRSSSQILSDQEKLQELRQSNSSEKKQEENEFLLQQQMLREGSKWEEQSILFRQSSYFVLSSMCKSIREIIYGVTGTSKIIGGEGVSLFKGMFRQGSFQENDGEGKFKLYSWTGKQGIYGRILSDEKGYQTKREALLLSMWEDSEREWNESGRSSCRLEQEEQYQGKLCSSVQELSHGTSRITTETPKAGKSFVVFVEREVWVPSKVYNIEVEDIHNYFAEGILVHNCMDDPIDPQKVMSEVELDKAGKFYPEVLESRAVNKEVTVYYCIMQRLHPRDPAGVLIEERKVEGTTPLRHICLPAEVSDDISPSELREKYVDGLLDPKRLGENVLRRYRSNAYVYAGQYMQTPTPAGAGMFRIQHFNNRVKAAPRDAKRVRAIDRACLVSGTKITTIQGLKNIEDVIEGDYVLTRQGYNKVVWSGISKYVNPSELITVDMANGLSITGTKDHRVWTENNGWIDLSSVRCCHYTIHNIPLGGKSWQIRKERWNVSSSMGNHIIVKKVGDTLSVVAGIKLQKNISTIIYIVPFGAFIQARGFPKDMMFIIKMETGIITMSRILSVFLGQNIIKYIILSRSGMLHQKQMHIEEGLFKRAGTTQNIRNIVVNNANLFFHLEELMLHQNSVLLFVAIAIVTNLNNHLVKYVENCFGLMERMQPVLKSAVTPYGREIVSCVGRYTTNLRGNNLLVEEVVEPNGSGKIPVYDLEVEDSHEFFANGTLVHNSTSMGGCYTAMVLMALDSEGYLYVEDCVHGQWEPGERNQIMRATALRDRGRYGPNHEPRICIEREGGSSGRDAWMGVVRALSGFRPEEITVTGAKDVRAEPWSAQCAAGLVKIVDDGTWDIEGFIREHVLFRPMPGKRLGGLKDRVDASSLACNILLGMRTMKGPRVVQINKTKDKKPRVVFCSYPDLANMTFETQNIVLVCLHDPDEKYDDPPKHGAHKLQGYHHAIFANLDPKDHQDTWNDPVEPWNLPAKDVMLTQDICKKLWGFLNRKRDPSPEIYVFADDLEERGISVSLAFVDSLRLPRESALFIAADPDNKTGEMIPPNQYVYDLVKATRSLVM